MTLPRRSDLPPPGAHVHLIGVAGAGMRGLGVLLLDAGYRLSGCDRAGAAALDELAERGAVLSAEHAASHVEGADLVIFSSAVPAVLVPFPGAAGSHQTANARAVQAAGAAVMREESELQAGELWELACGILQDEPTRLRMAAASGERGAPDAAERIALELLELIASGPPPGASR